MVKGCFILWTVKCSVLLPHFDEVDFKIETFDLFCSRVDIHVYNDHSRCSHRVF